MKTRRLEGSCHCKAVQFSFVSETPTPYQRCYCSVCRKANGGGGYAINIMGLYKSLQVVGENHITLYSATIAGKQSQMSRAFCNVCGSGLWGYDPRWPDIFHPFASAIDTDLPVPAHNVHIMVSSKANWVDPAIQANDVVFEEYPDQSITAWHKKYGGTDI